MMSPEMSLMWLTNDHGLRFNGCWNPRLFYLRMGGRRKRLSSWDGSHVGWVTEGVNLVHRMFSEFCLECKIEDIKRICVLGRIFFSSKIHVIQWNCAPAQNYIHRKISDRSSFYVLNWWMKIDRSCYGRLSTNNNN